MFRSVRYYLCSNDNNNVYSQVSIINVISSNQYFNDILILNLFALNCSKLEHT